MRLIIKLSLIIICIFNIFSISSLAEEFNISVSVDRDTVPLNERLVYDISLSGAETNQIPSPELPDLKGKFKVISSSESSSFSWINGKVSVSKTKRYVLNPLRKGDFVIKPARVRYKGVDFKSEPIRVQVVSPNRKISVPSNTASRQSSSARGRNIQDPFSQFFQQDPFSRTRTQTRKKVEDSVFLKANVDKVSVIQGEQLRYSLKLYRRVQLMSNLELGLPSFEGFGVEKLGRDTNEKIEVFEGKRYYVMELTNRLLYPLKSGNILIKPAEVGIMISLFDGRRVLKTNPIVVKVNTLPEKKRPLQFNGAVGDFSLIIDQASYSVTANTPLTMKVTLEGTGNLKTIQDLQFQEKSNYKLYKSNIEEYLDSSGFIVNKKVFEYIFIPKEKGEFKLPGFSLDYYSINENRYKTVQTQTIKVMVSESLVFVDAQNIGIGSSVKILQEDLRYLQSVNLKRNYSYFFENIAKN